MKWMLPALSLLILAPLAQAIESGKPAPAFTAKTSDGKSVKLADYKGKSVVVLEWLNYGCPFVQKHYNSKNMQSLQEKYTGQGVVWFSVISSAKGKQGHATPAQAEKDRKDHGSKATGVILDESGALGKLYGAETTPHIFVIGKDGSLVYQGAIDDKNSTDLEDVKTAKSYLVPAVDAALASKTLAKAESFKKAYGCSVKYN